MPHSEGQRVDIGDTELFVVERGQGHPLILLHGGPGLDHHMFGDDLDALGDHCRLILVDPRAHGRSGRAGTAASTSKTAWRRCRSRCWCWPGGTIAPVRWTLWPDLACPWDPPTGAPQVLPHGEAPTPTGSRTPAAHR